MSSEQDDVLSPPYPALSATMTNQYRILYALREWAIVQINQMKEEVPPSKAAELEYPQPLPSEASWEIISIVDHYTSLMFTRRIRETWDAILREHEQDWDSKLCLKKRYYLLQSTLHVLKESFVDPEERKERYVNSLKETEERMRIFAQNLNNLIVPPELRPPEQAVDQDPEEDEEW